MTRAKPAELIADEQLARAIWIARGLRVMLDADLAQLYDVPTKALLQAVKRNATRFPQDFMFQLTPAEFAALRSQSVTSKRGGRRYLPYVFTEQGVAMLSSVLQSERAIAVNIQIVRTFVKLREWLATNKELAHKLQTLERKLASHDQAIASVLEAIKTLMRSPKEPKKRPIGFG
jgi:phage regulator Rha-like protein